MAQITVQLLKEDSFGRVECLELDGQRVLRRVACGGRWPGSGGVARWLLGRERRALQRLAGQVGFPQLAEPARFEWAWAYAPEGQPPIPTATLLVREFVAGEPLSAAAALPSNFFDLLDALVARMHALGVCHNDLHKEQNVLVDAKGYPCLIDFQLASLHPKLGRAFATRCHEDRRHVQKHRRRYLRDGRGPQGLDAPTEEQRLRRKPLSQVWRKTAKPLYEFVTRRLLKYRDGEARRPSSGPWPRWEAALEPQVAQTGQAADGSRSGSASSAPRA